MLKSYRKGYFVSLMAALAGSRAPFQETISGPARIIGQVGIVGTDPDHMVNLPEPHRPEFVVLNESPKPISFPETAVATDPGFRIRLPVPRHNFANQTESEMDARMDAAAEKRNRKTLARLGKAK